MKRIKLVYFLLIIVLIKFFSVVNLGAQTYARVKIISGGSPTFLFNSLSRYTDGITLPSWTKLKLELNEDVLGHTGWELSVMASAATIESDGGSPDLDLSSIQIRIESIDAVTNTVIDADNSPLELSNAAGPSGYGDVLLAGTGDTNMEVELTISYDCGTTLANQLLGNDPDYYYVDLWFRLYSIP